MEKDIFITKKGSERLAKELDELKKKRRGVAARIKAAREFGDLSENSEYADAKDEQAFVEGRISEIEHILKNAKIIEDQKNNKTFVQVGDRVLVSLDSGEIEFQIVGSYEADPEQGLISNESPIGQALLGRKPGDAVEVNVPAGKIIYTIKKIS